MGPLITKNADEDVKADGRNYTLGTVTAVTNARDDSVVSRCNSPTISVMRRDHVTNGTPVEPDPNTGIIKLTC